LFKKAVSHKNDQIFQSYISSVIGIDTQNVVRNLPEDQLHVDLTRSIAFARDINRPKPHGSTLDTRDVCPDRTIIGEISAQFPKDNKKEIMRKARRQQFLEMQKAYRDNDTPAPNAQRVTGLNVQARINPTPSPLFRQMLKYNTIQASVIENLWSCRSTSISTSVELLLPLTTGQDFCVWYPQPVKPPSADMICPYCKANFAKRTKRATALHILDCHLARYQSSFCFDCADFSDTKTHSCSSYDLENISCGVVYWRDLVIRPGRCPFCWDGRDWLDALKLRDHIQSHLGCLDEDSLSCPHRLCSEQHSSRADLQNHLISLHGIGGQSRHFS
jgi:hypothetical protein